MTPLKGLNLLSRLSSFLNKAMLIAFTLLVTTPNLLAADATNNYQEESLKVRPFNKGSWKKSVDGIDYFTSKKKKSQPRDNSRNLHDGGGGRETPSSNESSWSPATVQLFSNIFKVLAILAGIAVIILILVFALKDGFQPRNKINSVNGSISLEDVEDNLNEHDPTDLIQRAVLEGDYKLAIRLYYLKVLRELSLAGNILWKKDKTNREYLYELTNAPFQTHFRDTTYIFERIWYGNHHIELAEFTSMRNTFDELLQKITRTK
ncbi:MAG: DUF4129 domain-containing protein [Saprospiraceae bacterium]|nr:DUF4129 domain-containing protein [Saprospiraceae bacterium]